MNEEQVRTICLEARGAVSEFRKSGLQKRVLFYSVLAKLIREKKSDILKVNQLDQKNAKEMGLSPALVDRLVLDEKRIDSLASSVEEVSAQPDPLGISEGKKIENGLTLNKVSIGIGVIGFIYESRPGVTIDAAILCLKAGNAVVLKGGKEAVNSNILLETIVRMALRDSGLPVGLVSLLDCTDRDSVGHLIRMQGILDLVIPRGGKGLISRVVNDSRVPVIKHYDGNCHLYVHESANSKMALELIDNAKTQRPGVCNALESLLVDESVAEAFLPKLLKHLSKKSVELRFCPKGLAILPGQKEATEEDYGTEYLDLILSVVVVSNLETACEHIEKFGSGHTDGIIAQDVQAISSFNSSVDSAVIVVNTSTRFNDGGQFGLGAEIGISTDRLHARGPMGAMQLTTYKYIVEGQGQIRL